MITFDTNILIYAAHPRETAKQKTALDILAAANDGILLWQVACEFIAASRKLAEFGFTKAEAWDQLTYYLLSFPLLTPRPSILENARLLHVERQCSFWDAMIFAGCIDVGVTRLYSEDLPGRKPPDGLEIINPFA